MSIVEEARLYAIAAHSAVKQVRKYTGVPYYEHPRAVAELVSNVGGTPEMIAAAWLHDVVEDTGCTIENIRDVFGLTVALYVEALTDVSKPEDGNRVTRKKLDREHIANACPQAKTIKLADMIDNTSTITKYDPDFAKVYMFEKKELLAVLSEGNQKLLERAWRQINDYEATLVA